MYTYLVSIVTVVLLFCVAGSLNTNSSKGNTIQTASTTQKLLPIYNVQTEQKKVAFTMNCAWSQLFLGQKIKELVFASFKCLRAVFLY